MTEYVEIPAGKRYFIVPATINHGSLVNVASADDTRIVRDGDTRITRAGDTRIVHNTSPAYVRVIKAEKRMFVIQAEVQNG